MPYQFTFGENGHPHNPMFQGLLHSFQCEGHNKNGARCKRTTVIGEPLCWQHMESEKNLKIKESQIPHAGKGLFAYDNTKGHNAIIFQRGDDVTPFLGQEINLATLENRYGE